MKIKKKHRSNIIFVIFIALLLIPQTRKPIQIALNKVMASVFSPSVIDEEDRNEFVFSDWNLKSINGKSINFNDLKGEVVLLNFWATWCPPCVAELPSIESLSKDYNEKIKIVLVSNEKPEKVISFFKEKGYNLDSYSPLENYPEGLNISSIPRTFLIDKSGRIVIDKTGAANWNSNKIRNQIDSLIK